jgi:methenyltetrahydromethanopterin cyclohydrolase|tara:strand:+ start:829 stop:1788 length:960 start_codon:yes stop_codon:yes gene_type:complete
MISVSEESNNLVQDLIDNFETYNINLLKGFDDCTIIDAGINCPGSIECGRVVSEICLGGLGRVHLLNTFQSKSWPFSIHVNTKHPVISCLGSQYAGWNLKSNLKSEKFQALGSGPARALAQKEEIFDHINYKDKFSRTALVMEVDSIPPEDVVKKIIQDTGVEGKNLTIIITPTTSIVGNIQVVSRVLEVALHKSHELGFDLSKILEGFGSAPIPPNSNDFLEAMGRTNDAIIFSGVIQLWVNCEDEEAEKLCKDLPSSTSQDYGMPFADIFKKYEYDFFKIDPNLFSPAQAFVINLKTGKTFQSGSIDEELMKKSFNL